MKTEIANYLRTLEPGQRVYAMITRVARSGMSRCIRIFTLDDGRMNEITHMVARACGWPMTANDGLRVGGCGMDMRFHVVYTLGRVLFPNGYECAGADKCRSNDHSNGDRVYTPHLHRDGGYAFRCETL